MIVLGVNFLLSAENGPIAQLRGTTVWEGRAWGGRVIKAAAHAVEYGGEV